MEDFHLKPTPLPRSSPGIHNQDNISGCQLKKPVPLPRTTPMATASSSKTSSEGNKPSSDGSSFDEVITKSYNTLTKSLKNKFKSANDSVQGKCKAVMETTKTVGSKTEKSVKGILQKHQSGVSTVNSKSEENSRKPRCQSLPSEDIFNSISFGSPILQDKLDRVYDSDSDESSMPPPEYPPPPLPDESLYDEVSTKSSHSGSHGDYYTCQSLSSSLPDDENITTYEGMSDFKHLSLCGGSDSNSSQSFELTTDSKSKHSETCASGSGFPCNCDVQSASDTRKVTLSRSESWTFYDTVHIPNKPSSEQYVNVTIHGQEKIKGSQNKEETLSQPEHKIIPLKPLQPIKVSSECDLSLSKSAFTRQDSTRSSTGSTASSMSVPNELYLNWQPPMSNKMNKNSFPPNNLKNSLFATKTFFSEFDPLYENLYSDGKTGDKQFDVESLPLFQNKEQSDFNDDFDTLSLPVPPTRYDSIPTEITEQPEISNNVEYFLYHRPSICLPVEEEVSPTDNKEVQAAGDSTSTTPENSPSESPDRELYPGKRKSNLVRWTSMKRAIRKVTDGSNWSPGVMRKTAKNKDGAETTAWSKEERDFDAVERPHINTSSAPIHSGFLFRSPSGGERQKDFVQKWCQLAEGRLTYSAERNSSNKDVILVEHIYSLQIVRETKQSNEGEDIYCMEMSCSLRDKPYLVGSPGTTERRIWMQKLLESLTHVFPPRLTADYTRAGWCYLKEGISGSWLAAWTLLHKRTLFFHLSSGKMSEVDLRKARCIVLQENEEGCVRVAEKGPVIRIDSPGSAYYLQMNEPRESKAWCRVVHEAAVDNGPMLHEQQLTKDDLPTIIDKCINFVYAHGSMSEGIYRRSGSNSSVTKLLTSFQKDAWAVQITRNDYSEHDVASVLKRFFRDLPEPLLTT